MAMFVTDPYTEERLKAEREASGADRYDEVWDGVYMMTPLPGGEHQEIVLDLGIALRSVLGRNTPHKVYPGINVSDRMSGWEHNYRAPDVAVYLNGTQAKYFGTHWCGGPDFAVEIVSPGDHSRDKFDFYAKVGTGELLIIDRYPWKLELYRLEGNQLRLVAETTAESANSVESKVVPLTFRLLAGEERPQIEVKALATAAGGEDRWLL